MPEALSFKDLLDLIEKLETRLNAYWNFYSVAVLAAGGWLLTRGADFTPGEGAAVMAALACFFAANFAVIRAATRAVLAAGQEVRARAETLSFSSPALPQLLRQDLLPGRLPVSLALHLAVDAAVLYVIWTRIG